MSGAVVIIGGGGHAKVVVASLRRLGVEILGAVVADPAAEGPESQALGCQVLGGDDVLDTLDGQLRLVNGIGSVKPGSRRISVFRALSARGWRFATVVDPHAVVADGVVLGEGALVMAGAVIQPGSRIGANAIVNTRAAVDHDCLVADHAHLAPGVTLSGAVTVGEDAHLGTAATVIQGVRIGAGTLVAAGAVVVSDLPPGCVAMGVPARLHKGRP